MIGIYGGTFDPVHFGHLRPALDVYSALSLSKIHFIPCGLPPHREPPVATGRQRMEMLQLALHSHPEFEVDDRELSRDGPSYMIDTIRSLKQEYRDERFCLIVGVDAFIKLNTWSEWQEITRLVSLVVTHRPSFDLASITGNEMLGYINEKHTHDMQLFKVSEDTHCIFCPVTQLDISSTSIRELVNKGHSIDFLLPASVAEYIEKHKLYM